MSEWDHATADKPVAAIAWSDSTKDISLKAAFGNISTHILAREVTAAEIGKSLDQGRTYVAHDWMCDPAGFFFFADNNLGVFEIGDTAPSVGVLAGSTQIVAHTPVPAKIRLLRDGTLVQETSGT